MKDFAWLSGPGMFARSLEWINAEGKHDGELCLSSLNRAQTAAALCEKQWASESKLKEVLVVA